MEANNTPVRKVRPNFRSSTGILCSVDNGNLHFESKLERDAILLLEFDRNVEKIFPQPMRIGNYVPDLLVFNGRKPRILEIKYVNELVEKWPQLSTKYRLAEEYAQSSGAQFGFITDDTMSEQRNRLEILKAIKLLGRNKSEQVTITERIHSFFSESRCFGVKDVVESLNEFQAGMVIAALCRSILTREFFVKDTPTRSIWDVTLVSVCGHEVQDGSIDYIMSIDEFSKENGLLGNFGGDNDE